MPKPPVFPGGDASLQIARDPMIHRYIVYGDTCITIGRRGAATIKYERQPFVRIRCHAHATATLVALRKALPARRHVWPLSGGAVPPGAASLETPSGDHLDARLPRSEDNG